MQLGLRQARYVGRAKTLGQLFLAAAVANLTLVATSVGLMRGRRRHMEHLVARILGLIVSLIPTRCPTVAHSLPRRRWVLAWR